jgi:hypothetical protein
MYLLHRPGCSRFTGVYILGTALGAMSDEVYAQSNTLLRNAFSSIHDLHGRNSSVFPVLAISQSTCFDGCF